MRHADLLDCIDIIDDISPLKFPALFIDSILKLFTKYHGQKRTEHMACNGLVQ